MQYVALALAALYALLVILALLWNCAEWLLFRFVRAERGEEYIGDLEHPQAIITLVHGTWSKSAQWTKPSSNLCQAILGTLPANLLIFRFGWSGRNSIYARSNAAAALEHKLEELVSRYPAAKHFVIGHSHGGSVALSSLNSTLADKICGMICLATPVLMGQPRKYDPFTKYVLFFVPSVLLVFFAVIIVNLVGLADSDAGVPLGVLGAIALGLFAPKLITKWVSTLKFVANVLPEKKIIFIRAAADEASAVLDTAHFFSWVLDKLWTSPTRVLWNAHRRVEGWRNLLIQHWKAALLIVGAATIIIALCAWQGEGTYSNILVLVSVGIVAIMFALWARGNFFTWLVVAVFASILMIPMCLVLAALGLVIGPEMAVAAALMEITVEPTPAGTWTLVQLGFDPLRKGRSGLAHSSVYEDARAIRIVCEWLRMRYAQASFGDAE